MAPRFIVPTFVGTFLLLGGISMLVKKLMADPQAMDQKEVEIQGWVRTNRNSKNIGF